MFFFSCKKEGTSSATGNSSVQDQNNYFTATFSGKTIRTSGYVLKVNGEVISGGINLVGVVLNTVNAGGSVETLMGINVSGSVINLAYGTTYNIPVQQLDAYIVVERTGNSVGSYTTPTMSYITDLTVGSKRYDLDEASTVINVTSADALYVQGNYSGKLVDGSSLIPVTGTFKLRK